MLTTHISYLRFRWVSLQLQSICRPGILLEGDVREKLRHPPQNLTAMYSEVYNQMYSQLGPESQQIMKRVLKWLLCAQRQLSTDELLAAVSIKSSKEFTRVSKQDVLDMCYNFVVLDNEMDIFRFTHLSVREYLEGCEEYSVALAHSLAAEKCLLLCLATPSDYKRPESAVAKARSFRDYAMLHWVTHCQMSDHYRHEGTLGQLFNKFVHRNPLVSPSFQEWTQSAQLRMQSTAWNDPLKARIESAFSSPPDPFFAACAWGFLDLVESSLRSRKIITHITNSRGHAGLRIASDYDQNDVVQFLLNEGADVMAKAKDGSTALHVAVGRGNSKATSLLLGKGAKIEAKDESGRTPLHKASETGNEETLRLLLENGANPSATHNGGWTPLHCAAEKGNEAAVMLLLDNEKLVDLEVEDEFGCTALYLAAERGHEQVVQHLLRKNAVVDAVDSYGGTALGQAVENGHKGIVRLLLEAHADVNKCGALQRAAERGNDEILPLLIEYGADIEAKESPGIQALHMASERGHMTAVEQLIKRGADIESKDYYGRTPLYHAAAGGYERVVQLLLDNGADIMTGDMDMKTPLHEAAARGHGPVVQLLLGKLGRRPPETDNSGKTALDWAIEGQHMAVVGLFESQV
jgi:ankyrin repeat protein